MAAVNVNKEKNDNNEVFSPDRDFDRAPGTVSNEDLMTKLCANSSQIARLSDNVEQMRSQILALQMDNDSLRKEVRDAKEREESLKQKVEEMKFSADLIDRRTEELALYTRRNNLRIFGVDEAAGEGSAESFEECEQKVLKLFKEKLKVNVSRADIEAVHRLGSTRTGSSTQQQQQQRQPRQPRGIIVRFISRRVRDSVLYARRKLQGTRMLIVEDLTPRAYSLLCKVRDDTTICAQAWTKNGKVFMKTVSSKIVPVQSLAELAEHKRAHIAKTLSSASSHK